MLGAGAVVLLVVLVGGLLATGNFPGQQNRNAATAIAAASGARSNGNGSSGGPGTSALTLGTPGPGMTIAGADQVPGIVPAATGFAPGAQLPGSVPDASGLGPPAWVRPGTRLTWYGAAASVAQSSYTYVEDPEGTWVDPETGKHYRRTDESPNPQDMPTAAGEGYTQTDVLAVEGNDVVLANTLYSIDLMARQLTLNPLGGSRIAGAAVDGAWVNPDLLRSIEASGYGDLTIVRGDYTLNGVIYHAISFINSAAYQDSTFDTETGVLLATNASTQGQGPDVHGPLDNPQGNIQLSHTRLAGVRHLSLPGIDATKPDWAVPDQQLSYSGTATVVNPLDPGAGPFAWPMQMTVTLGEGGRTWATFTSSIVIDFGGTQQPTEAAGVTGPTGLYWYDPTTLTTLTPGQVLDEDPVTGARTTVETVSPGEMDTVVGLLTEMNGVTVRLGYDQRSGVLLSLEITQAVTGSTIQLQLAASSQPG
jgi:hypothetical protein